MSLISIYNKNKKRRGRSRYLLSVMVDVVKDGNIIPAKVVYVRNRNKRKEYLCIIQQILNWMKMKSSAFMENDGISKFSSKSAKVTCI